LKVTVPPAVVKKGELKTRERLLEPLTQSIDSIPLPIGFAKLMLTRSAFVKLRRPIIMLLKVRLGVALFSLSMVKLPVIGLVPAREPLLIVQVSA
jgi:hypothetical protein